MKFSIHRFSKPRTVKYLCPIEWELQIVKGIFSLVIFCAGTKTKIKLPNPIKTWKLWKELKRLIECTCISGNCELNEMPCNLHCINEKMELQTSTTACNPCD